MSLAHAAVSATKSGIVSKAAAIEAAEKKVLLAAMNT
jgi:hypothetical protein